MLAPFAYGRADTLPTGLVDQELGFLRMPALLAAIGSALFFCGRCTGLSVASITMTSNWGLLSLSFFLPGRGNAGPLSKVSSTLCTIRQTAASERCHDTAI